MNREAHREMHLAGVFPSWEDAARAVTDLHEYGLGDDFLGLVIHAEGDHGLVMPAENDLLDAVGEGALVGVPVGVLAGLAVVAVAVPGMGTVGAGGILAAGGGAAALGALMGSVTGATLKHGELADARAFEEVPLAPGEVMVYVNPPDDQTHIWTDEKGEMEWGPIQEELADIFHRHGGRMLELGPRHHISVEDGDET